jgi:NAD(P)H-dependent nitrite reductase small subunit
MNSLAEEFREDRTEKMTDTEFMAVCQIDDLLDNLGQCALVKGKQIALFKVSDSEKIYAIDNHDPFSDANVLSRGVVGDLQGKLVVASPIYKQHFDLETGQCLEDENVVLDTYATRVVAGVVEISC